MRKCFDDDFWLFDFFNLRSLFCLLTLSRLVIAGGSALRICRYSSDFAFLRKRELFYLVFRLVLLYSETPGFPFGLFLVDVVIYFKVCYDYLEIVDFLVCSVTRLGD